MSHKRILIFSLAYYPLVGGAEIAVKEITDRIPDIEFDMVTMRFDPVHALEEKIGNVNVYRVKSNKLTFPIEAMLYAKKLHKKYKYDAIWAIMANRAGGAALFFKYSFPKVKFILTLQEGDPVSYMKRRSLYYINPFFKKIFSNADVVQAISHYLADYANIMGYKGAAKVIPNGVDVRRFQNPMATTQKNTLRIELGLGEWDTVLITTSRLEKKNAVADVIDALHFLPENTKFLILGTGTLDERLKMKVKSQNLESRVIFLGDISNQEIPAYLHISDVFIRPSLSEGFGISFIEAMAAGLPVIATPVGGIVDFLFDPEESPGQAPTGLFVEPGNPEDIAKKVTKLTDNRALRATLIENAQKLVGEKYDWNLVSRQMRQVFDIVT